MSATSFFIGAWRMWLFMTCFCMENSRGMIIQDIMRVNNKDRGNHDNAVGYKDKLQKTLVNAAVKTITVILNFDA